MTETLTQYLIDLCRIPSPSHREGQVAAYIKSVVAELGLSVQEDDMGQILGSDTGNLLIQSPGRGEPLFLAAHMDTMPPTLINEAVPVVIDGDKIHTAGQSILGADDKAGIAVALEMLRLAVQNPEHTRPLDVIFTIQEEQGTLGASRLDPDLIRAHYGFNLDGDTPVGVAINHAPYKVRYRVDVKGRAAHAAVNPEDGRNAVATAGAIAAALPGGRLDEFSVANVGRIEGGQATNMVPDRAWLIGEVRSLHRDRLDALKIQFEAIIQQEANSRGTSVTIEWEELYAGYHVAPDAPPAALFAAACTAEGLTAEFVTTYGGGDANPFNNKGLACVVFGLGMAKIHTPDEYIHLSDLSKAAAILRQAIQAN